MQPQVPTAGDSILPIISVKLVETAGRLDWLRERYESKVGRRVFDQILKVDPTPKKIYAQWALNLYVAGKLKAEDIYKLEDDLKLFDRHKRRLPQKDINRVKTPQELYALIEPFQDRKTGKEQRRDQAKKMAKYIRVVYDGPEGKVLVPKTEQASCYVGQGTRWCTAGKKSNYFKEYNQDGPLYVLIPAKPDYPGEKYQMHFPSAQLRDELDDDGGVDADNYPRNIPVADHYPRMWKAMQDDLSDKDKNKAIDDSGGEAAYFIDKLSPRQINLTLEQNPLYIANIPKPSEQQWVRAIKNKRRPVGLLNAWHSIRDTKPDLTPKAQLVFFQKWKPHPHPDLNLTRVLNTLRKVHVSALEYLAAHRPYRLASAIYGTGLADSTFGVNSVKELPPHVQLIVAKNKIDAAILIPEPHPSVLVCIAKWLHQDRLNSSRASLVRSRAYDKLSRQIHRLSGEDKELVESILEGGKA